MEKYETIEFLGEGSFAKVIKAKDKKTEETVAIKKLKKKYTIWQECVDLREVKSLNKLKQNDNIIKLKEMIRIEDTLYLVFEYMEKNLYQLITERQNKKLSEGQIRFILWQTLQGVAYMHKYGFFHRDLKPENLLVSNEKIKIADFGLAREIRSIPPYTDYVSTRYYRAPECILKSTNYNSPVDIWAVGCIMAELYNFKPIFYGASEKEVLFRMASIIGTPNNLIWAEGLQLAKKIGVNFPATLSNSTSLSQVIPDASSEALELIGEMLKWDPNKRATAPSLLSHPFFTGHPLGNRISSPEKDNIDIGLYSLNQHQNEDKDRESSSKKTFNSYNHNKIDSSKKELEPKIKITEPYLNININTELNYTNKKDNININNNNDDEISKLLEDTVGFNKCKKYYYLNLFKIFIYVSLFNFSYSQIKKRKIRRRH
jgi:MAK-like kinase